MSQERITQLEQENAALKSENELLRNVISNFFLEYLDMANNLSRTSQLFSDLANSTTKLTTDFVESMLSKARDVKELEDGTSIEDLLRRVVDDVEEHVEQPDLFEPTAEEVPTTTFHDSDYSAYIDWEIRREKFVEEKIINPNDANQVKYWMDVFEAANPKPIVRLPDTEEPTEPNMVSAKEAAEQLRGTELDWSNTALKDTGAHDANYLSELSRDYMELGQSITSAESAYEWSKTKESENGKVNLAMVDDRHYLRYSDDELTCLFKCDPITGAIDIFNSTVQTVGSPDKAFVDLTVEEVSKITKNLRQLFV